MDRSMGTSSSTSSTGSEEEEEGGLTLHVVAIPFPLQGHIAPMLQLCNLLAARGMRITFVHLESNLSRLAQSSTTALEGPHSNIRYVSLPDCLPGKPSSCPSSTRSRVLASEKLVDSFSHLVAALHATSKVSCIIADALMSWAHTVGGRLGILGAALWTGALSSCAAYCSIPLLASKRYLPIKDIDGGPQQVVRCIRGLPQIFSFTDLPSFFQAPSWPDDVLDFISRQMKLMGGANWVLSNSASLEFERQLEEELRKEMPIMSIGPLLALGDHHTQVVGTQSMGMRASLWREDPTCLEWLKGRPPSSVLYVSFGSLVVLPMQQIEEIAMGLEASQHPFLWALRPESIEGEDGEASQYEFTSRIAHRGGGGLVVSWAPQLEVLAHDSIGGFLTHCGWNSVMESVAMGKPMLGLPRFAEQKMNCKLVEQWRVGKELQVGEDGLVKKHEVDAQVRYLMSHHDNNILRSTCAELRAHVLNAFSNEEGSSFKNLDKFVNELLEKDKMMPFLIHSGITRSPIDFCNLHL